MLTRTLVYARSTLPALSRGGSPSIPIISKLGRQVLFKINSTGSKLSGVVSYFIHL